MNEALKIMDEIESGVGKGLPISLPMTHEQWQSLRTTLEAQVEELAQAKARIARLEEGLQEALNVAEHFVNRDIGNTELLEGQPLSERSYNLWLEAGHKRLRPLHDVFDEHPRQSAAALKAAALREEARRLRQIPGYCDDADEMDAIADRIERERKEASDGR